MVVKVFFLFLFLSVHTYRSVAQSPPKVPTFRSVAQSPPNIPTFRSVAQSPLNVSRTRFTLRPFGQGPISSGIVALGGVLSNGIKEQGNIVMNGVNNAAQQVSQLSTDIKQQTVDIITTGAQFAQDAVAQISMPALTTGTLLIIAKFNFLVTATGCDTVKIDPVNTRLMGFGSLTTSEGKLTKLSTLKLDGLLRITPALTSFRLAIPLSFQNLSVSFDKYAFSTWGININGDLNARIRNNSFIAHVIVRPGILCQVNVERVEVTRLEDIDVQMTGLCSWCSSIVSYVANFLQGMIRPEVQKAVDAGLKSVLTENSLVLCSIPVLSTF